MNLFIADADTSFEDLFKAVRINLMPKTPGAATGPKTPGAATGGSGTKLVDCPLGAACPSGGKHKPGSKKLDRHTQQAQKQGLTGKPAGDESKGEDAGKPGVTAATQNIGSVGSDQPTGVGPGEEKPTLLAGEAKAPEEKAPEAKAAGGIFESEESRQRLKEWASARTTGDESDSELDKMFEEYRTERALERMYGPAKLAEKIKAPLEGEAATGMQGVPRPKGIPRIRQEFVGSASKRKQQVQDTPEYTKYVSDISERVKAPLEGESAAGAGAGPAPSKKKPTIPTSLEEMADSAPPESKPMDHYRLAEVARASGDPKASSKHEALARQRSEGMMSTDHKELADQLRAEGLHDQAKYHDDIAARAATPPKLPKQRQTEQEQKVQQEHSAKFQSVHAEQKAKAKKLLDDAKAVHEETKRKAGDILARNKKAIEDHKAAMADYEEKKEKGVKKLKKPKNPKLEREISVPDKPGLSEPESDSENLKHMSHTERAKKHADMIESHLRHNKNLTDDQRKQLERAHSISSFHSNIEHTPTAAHKAELAAAEEHTKKLGIKSSGL
jgi:hypothetical protein